MSRPLAEPGWYRARPGGGLERAAPLDDPPEEGTWDLVKAGLGETAVEEPLW